MGVALGAALGIALRVPLGTALTTSLIPALAIVLTTALTGRGSLTAHAVVLSLIFILIFHKKLPPELVLGSSVRRAGAGYTARKREFVPVPSTAKSAYAGIFYQNKCSVFVTPHKKRGEMHPPRLVFIMESGVRAG